MSSLWTPDGERPVRREPAPGPAEATPAGATGTDGAADGGPGDPLRAAAAALGVDLDAMSTEDREQLRAELEEMLAARREAAKIPAADLVARHLMNFGDLVTIYLEGEPPAFADAAIVIEALDGALERVGPQLGEHEPVLREMAGQLKMIFVDVKRRSETAGA